MSALDSVGNSHFRGTWSDIILSICHSNIFAFILGLLWQNSNPSFKSSFRWWFSPPLLERRWYTKQRAGFWYGHRMGFNTPRLALAHNKYVHLTTQVTEGHIAPYSNNWSGSVVSWFWSYPHPSRNSSRKEYYLHGCRSKKFPSVHASRVSERGLPGWLQPELSVDSFLFYNTRESKSLADVWTGTGFLCKSYFPSGGDMLKEGRVFVVVLSSFFLFRTYVVQIVLEI